MIRWDEIETNKRYLYDFPKLGEGHEGHGRSIITVIKKGNGVYERIMLFLHEDGTEKWHYGTANIYLYDIKQQED